MFAVRIRLNSQIAIFLIFNFTYTSEDIISAVGQNGQVLYSVIEEKLCGALSFRQSENQHQPSAGEYDLDTTNLPDLFSKISSENFVEFVRILPTRPIEKLVQVKSYPNCRLTFCDEDALMGNCFHVQPNTTISNKTVFEHVFQSDLKSALCTCEPAGSNLWQDIEQVHPFDRNLVGVIFSAYDRDWEEDDNGSLVVPQKDNYTKEELRVTLRQMITRFTQISTYDRRYNDAAVECDKGVMSCVPQIAAEINKDLGFLALRVEIGFEGRVIKPLQVFINSIASANKIFPGSVWGISVGGGGLNDTLDLLCNLANLREQTNLNFKIGVRLEFRVFPKDTDDAFKNLIEFGKNADYFIIIHKPPLSWSHLTINQVLQMTQREFSDFHGQMTTTNPKLKLLFGSGIPSGGTQNGLPTENTMENFRVFWNGMIDYAKRTQSPFLIFEATDQPFKCNKADNSTEGQYDNVGPNGTQCQEGWFYRVNNSLPPVYLEKVAQIVDGEEEVAEDDEGESFWDGIPQFAKILVGAFAAVVVFGVGLTGYFRRQLNRSKDNVISSAYVEQFQKGGDNWIAALDRDYAVALRMPYDKRLELKKNEFHIDKAAVIGSGQSGIVMKGTMNTVPEPVVFKCTTPISSVVDIKNLMSEIKILSFIGKHEFIVCLLGAQTKKIQKGVIVVALELCQLGSLEGFLRKINPAQINANVFGDVPNANCNIDAHRSPEYLSFEAVVQDEFVRGNISSMESELVKFKSLLLWAFQVASTMAFVSAKKVIHADLAARNVLLSSVDHVKIADFGLSRRLYYQELGVVHDKDTPLPWRWMAPECLKNLLFSVESDIWAYAVLLWEIFSLGEVPYQGISYDMHFADELLSGMRLPCAKYSADAIHKVLLECWDVSPLNRPSFIMLTEFFQSLFKLS